jgi:hypothetical protein
MTVDSNTFSTPISRQHAVVQTIVFSGDEAAYELDERLVGYWLAQAEVISSADTSVAVALNTGLGGEIGALASDDYTGGSFIPLAAGGAENRYCARVPTITVSGIGSGTFTVEIVAEKTPF